MSLETRLRFLKQYIRHPARVGAVAPSSRTLAAAVCGPLRRHAGPAHILEVGAGTGAITKYLGTILGPEDRLDINEISHEFADILERDVLSSREFAPALREGRVRVLRMPVQQIPADQKYDFVISGLPLTAFSLKDVQDVISVIQRVLKPGGVFSYYEYIGARKASIVFSPSEKRDHRRQVSGFLTENIRRHQYDKQVVLRNIPPAHARHLRFASAAV